MMNNILQKEVKNFVFVVSAMVFMGAFGSLAEAKIKRIHPEAPEWSFSQGVYSPSKDKIVFGRYAEQYSAPSYEFPSGYNGKLIKKQFELCILDIKTSKINKIADIAGSPTSIPPDVYFSWQENLIAYSASIQKNEFGSIYIINSDGSNHKKLTLGKHPKLSLDGQKISYVLNENEERVISTDGSEDHKIDNKESSRQYIDSYGSVSSSEMKSIIEKMVSEGD